MKTETNSMRIVKPEKESEKAVVEPQKEKATGKPKYKPVEPVTLETVPEDAVFSAPRMYANCSTSATQR